MKAQLLELFPSPIMVVNYGGEELDAISREIEGALASIELRQDDTRHRVQTSYSPGVSNDIVNHGLFQLGQSIEEALLLYQQRVGVKPQPLKLVESWVNEYHEGGYMSEHEHPGNVVSGVYYHQADEHAGSLCFRNPNPLMLNCHWPGRDIEYYQTAPIPAETGRLVLFPSWMAHAVSTVKSHKISISFNLQ
jgi:uncharacterized protein (TIGR02466 family)